MTKNSPIGFFDSGVGGLSVYARFREVLPQENTIYFGDLKNLPYGNKTQDELIGFAKNILDFLQLDHNPEVGGGFLLCIHELCLVVLRMVRIFAFCRLAFVGNSRFYSVLFGSIWATFGRQERILPLKSVAKRSAGRRQDGVRSATMIDTYRNSPNLRVYSR